MPMKPKDGESRSDFLSRCIPEMMGDGKRDKDQAVAACISMYGQKGYLDAGGHCTPEPGEDYNTFLERCIDEGGDEEECHLIWEDEGEKSVSGRRLKHKTHASPSESGMMFILSDDTPDRMGDVIVAEGWDLTNFRKNPVALFNHNPDFVIGMWKSLWIEGNSLRGHLQLAPEGTSARIDEIRKLVDAGILRATSVGFRPIDSEPRKSSEPIGGVTYKRCELIETSLVAVPANPNALAVAKSLRVSPGTIDLVFAKHGKGNGNARRGAHGKHADTSRSGKSKAMTTLAQRVTDAQARLLNLRDQLTEHLKSVDDTAVTDEQITLTNELNAKITQEEKGLGALRDAEARLASAANNASGGGDGGNGGGTVVKNGGSVDTAKRPFGLPVRKMDPLEYLVRAGTVRYMSKVTGDSIDVCRQKIYGNDEATKVIVDYCAKAATAPALTTVAGWAAELVQQVNASFMETLQPQAVFPQLSALGMSLSFGRNGRIAVPTRAATPTIAGSFVGEGQPIPVRQAAFSSVLLTPKKMAVITSWSREIDEHSVPAIEGLLRNAIQEDTAVSIDSVLLDSNAATAIRPAGIRNGVVGLTPTAGGGFAALVGDIKQLTGALLTATNGNIRNMAFIMNPQQALSISLIQPPVPGGLFPFADEVAAGRLRGAKLITSGTVPVSTVICIDAADFVVVGGEAPRFEISDQATLHMEDTTPLPIVAGTTAADPTRSLWQTDSLALRLILPLNWALRRTGTVSWLTAVTW